MRLIIENMKSAECIQKVEALLREMEMPCYRVGLGFVDFPDVVAPEKIKEFEQRLEQYLYEVRKGEKEKLAYLIKKILIEKIHGEEEIDLQLLPDYVKNLVYNSYRKLNKVFREVEGKSIKQFIILYRMELAKELIDNNALNVSEIADKLKYHDVSYFTKKFKKRTGFTPREYCKKRGQKE